MRWLADLLYPERCVGCGILARGGLCYFCIDAAPRLRPFVCGLCGYALPVRAPVCRECRGRGFVFDRARQSVAFRAPIRDAIHRYKYHGVKSLAGPLALLAAEAAGDLDPGPRAVVTWIPAAESRVVERGFDHGATLAMHVSQRLGLAAEPLLWRKRQTPAQMALESGFRRTNLTGAFAADRAPAIVLVVDDVFTTGATADEAARALKAAGASQVLIACVARTFAAAGERYNGDGFPSGSVVAGIGRRPSGAPDGTQVHASRRQKDPRKAALNGAAEHGAV